MAQARRLNSRSVSFFPDGNDKSRHQLLRAPSAIHLRTVSACTSLSGS